jgi:hypothetical protein
LAAPAAAAAVVVDIIIIIIYSLFRSDCVMVNVGMIGEW